MWAIISQDSRLGLKSCLPHHQHPMCACFNLVGRRPKKLPPQRLMLECSPQHPMFSRGALALGGHAYTNDEQHTTLWYDRLFASCRCVVFKARPAGHIVRPGHDAKPPPHDGIVQVCDWLEIAIFSSGPVNVAPVCLSRVVSISTPRHHCPGL